jgi:predicted NBD/HSP70 family sugar kinase
MYNGLRPSDIREENIKQIIKLFRSSEELYSRAEIARKLSLSAPSVSSIVNKLIKANVLYEREEGTSGNLGGRKPILLDLNKDCGYIIGVHIEYEQITIVLANISGIIKDKTTLIYEEDKNFICNDFLVNGIKNFLIKNNVKIKQVLSIGIVLPGIFDTKEKRVKFAPNISRWQNTPIKEVVEEAFECKVKIENAVNAAVLGERWKGKIIGNKDAIYIKIDKGIGAGILIDGYLFKGFANVAGEIGFMLTDRDYIPEHKNNFGAFENYFGIKAILNRAKILLNDDNLNFDKLTGLIKDGNEELFNIIEDVAINIGITIANITCVINPQIVVIGGEFVKIAPLFISKIKDIIDRTVPIPPDVVISELGEKVYYLGAIVQALEGIEDDILEKCVLN